MNTSVKLCSNEKGEIYRFLNKFYNKTDVSTTNESASLEWENLYKNPVEMADIIGVFIENKEAFKINMWVSLDENVLINVSENNADKLIRYLYERFPY